MRGVFGSLPVLNRTAVQSQIIGLGAFRPGVRRPDEETDRHLFLEEIAAALADVAPVMLLKPVMLERVGGRYDDFPFAAGQINIVEPAAESGLTDLADELFAQSRLDFPTGC